MVVLKVFWMIGISSDLFVFGHVKRWRNLVGGRSISQQVPFTALNRAPTLHRFPCLMALSKALHVPLVASNIIKNLARTHLFLGYGIIETSRLPQVHIASSSFAHHGSKQRALLIIALQCKGIVNRCYGSTRIGGYCGYERVNFHH